MVDVLKVVADRFCWDWGSYLAMAEYSRETNFLDDPILGIKHVGFKVRDLALSNFCSWYPAFDLHVTRVATRLGWISYGFGLLGDDRLEMGNNPGNNRQYLFLHRLFLLLADVTKGRFTPTDIDRILWHMGRTVCGTTPDCDRCPLKMDCPTGIHRA
jgi:hypothetical protein